MNKNRKSPRLKGYDYTTPGYYFVTAMVKNRECVFGEIQNGKMVLNDWGKIAYQNWKEIPIHFAHVELDEFIIMPNHVHGIICITDVNVVVVVVGAQHAAPLQQQQRQIQQPVAGSIPTIVRSYKSSVTNFIHRTGNPQFSWQRSFHDHIIRNNDELNRIRYYIQQNPARWLQNQKEKNAA